MSLFIFNQNPIFPVSHNTLSLFLAPSLALILIVLALA